MSDKIIVMPDCYLDENGRKLNREELNRRINALQTIPGVAKPAKDMLDHDDMDPVYYSEEPPYLKFTGAKPQ